MAFSSRLAKARNEVGLSQHALGDKIGAVVVAGGIFALTVWILMRAEERITARFGYPWWKNWALSAVLLGSVLFLTWVWSAID